MDVSERINLIIKEKYLSIRAFSKSIGFADTTIGNIISGKSEPGYKLLCAICEQYNDISIEWLMTGIGNMYRQNDEKPPGKEFVSIELYKDLRKQNEDLMEMLKQSQSQLNDMIQITTKLTIKTAQGNDAPQDNDVGCADVG